MLDRVARALSPLLWLAGFFVLRAFWSPGCDPETELGCGAYYPLPEIASWACATAGVIHLGIVIYSYITDRRPSWW